MTKATNSRLLTRIHFLSHHLKWIFMAGLNNQEEKLLHCMNILKTQVKWPKRFSNSLSKKAIEQLLRKNKERIVLFSLYPSF